MAQQQSWDSFYEEWSTLPDPGQAPATSGQSTYTASPYPTSRDPYGGQSYQTTSSGYYQEGNPYQQGNYDYTSTMIPATSEDSNDEGDYVSSPPSYGYQSQQSPTMTSTGYLSSSGGYQQPYNGLSSMTTPTNNYSMASPSRSYSTSSQSAPYDCEHCGKRFEKRHLLNRHSKLHTKPIACPVSGCSHRVAKSRDMNRHLMAQHPDHELARTLLASPTHMCPVNGCKYASIGFRRKDNLERHVRNVHERRIP
ncbi:hypothetical protein B0J14DRAFT_560610 [Halenospora varia]|nr:hypothetical protein B0J14DRAFT_560610 [Halenospora varia]